MKKKSQVRLEAENWPNGEKTVRLGQRLTVGKKEEGKVRVGWRLKIKTIEKKSQVRLEAENWKN